VYYIFHSQSHGINHQVLHQTTQGGGQKKTIAPDYLSIINAILNPQS
jgi:hypothetical protein